MKTAIVAGTARFSKAVPGNTDWLGYAEMNAYWVANMEPTLPRSRSYHIEKDQTLM
jgi:hypothetical protein